MLNKTIQKQILEHAEREYPKESCGLIVKVGRVKKYIPCVNSADTSAQQDEFVISAEEYANAEELGEIIAVVHSHPDATTQPSVRDRAVCSAMEIPWVICSWPDGDIRTIVPEKAPLLNRSFCHGTDWDCYGLIRDYYKEKLSINLPRYKHDSFWWEEGKNFYEDNFEDAGFVKVNDGSLNEHDVILMTIRANGVTNHGGVYIGKNLMMHHMFGKQSNTVVYGGYWEENTRFVLRHKDLV